MSPEGSSITFRSVRGASLRRSTERFAKTLESRVAKGRPFACLITTDSELRRLNRDFRGKDAATDVLSFPASEAPGPAGGYLGDLAISLARARAQAAEFGHTLDCEIQILMLHGVLHLLGMDHERDRGRMACAEKQWRARLGHPPGLIERVQA